MWLTIGEVHTVVPGESLAVGFLGDPATRTALDLGAVNVRALAAIQRSERLDRYPPFRSRPTRSRWSAETWMPAARASRAQPAGLESV